MKRVQAVIRPEKLDAVQHALAEAGFHGFMVHDVRGHGAGEPTQSGEYRGVTFGLSVKHKLLVDLLVEDDEVIDVAAVFQATASTGQAGDGLIFVIDIAAVYPITVPVTV
jgi:nitrogen regulatory protein P-II 1